MATGKTVTVKGVELPVQPFAVADIWYVTASMFQPLLVSVCTIDMPDPLENPVTLGEEPDAVHE